MLCVPVEDLYQYLPGSIQKGYRRQGDNRSGVGIYIRKTGGKSSVSGVSSADIGRETQAGTAVSDTGASIFQMTSLPLWMYLGRPDTGLPAAANQRQVS